MQIKVIKMVNKKYINIDLDDARIKDLADVISNKTSKKIIGYLVDKEASETEIARDLKLAANTVNYNVKKLLKSGLIEKSKTYFWSVKGKKIPYYSVADKKIVISPKSFSGVKQTFVTLVISGFAALGIKIYADQYLTQNVATTITERVAGDLVVEGDSVAAGIGSGTSAAGEVATETIVMTVTQTIPEIWMWFLIGAMVSLLVYFIVGKIKLFR